PNITWKIGGGNDKLSLLESTTVKTNTLSHKSGGTLAISSAVQFQGNVDLNGQSITGGNANLSGFNNIGASSITASSGFSGSLTGNVTGQVSTLSNHNTDSLSEGTNRKYFSDTLARSAVSVTDAGGDGSLAYNNTTGVVTYTGPSASETRAHLSAGTGVGYSNGEISIGQAVATNSEVTFAKVTADLTGDVTGTVSSLSNHDTDDVGEGATNKYFTDVRAQTAAKSALSVSHTGFGTSSYNSSTGAFTTTGPSATEIRGVLSGSTGVTLDSNGAISIGQSVAVDADVVFNQVNSDTFVGPLTGNVSGTVSSLANHDTDDVVEGTTNKYFSNTLARSALGAVTSGDGNLSYNSTTGTITYSGPTSAETRAHLSAGTGIGYTNGEISIGQSVATDAAVTFAKVTADLTGDVTGTVSSLSNHDTDDVGEGATNKYFTDARARAAVSVTDAGGDGSIAYNAGTGAITYTGPSASETRAHFSSGEGVTVSDGEISIGQGVGTSDNVTFGKVTVTSAPTQASDLANKAYVDATAQGLDVKDSVRVATTASIDLTNLPTSIDNVTLASGDRVLLKNQSSPKENGIYIANGSTWTRSVDMNEPSEIKGAFVFVEEGTVNQSAGFVQSGAGAIVVGTSAINFTQFTGAGSITAGTGLSKNGNVVSVNSNLTNVTQVGILAGLTLSNTLDLDDNSIVNGGTITADSFVGDVTGNVTGTVTSLANHDTDDVGEGANNQYFTTARARGVVSATDAGGDGSLAYNNSTGVITYTGPSASDTRAHFSVGTGMNYNSAAGQFSIGQSVGTADDVRFGTVAANLTGNVTGNVTGTVTSLANHDTDDVVEGTNQYFTNARAQTAAKSALSVSHTGFGSASYNSSTGAFTTTGASTSEIRGVFSGSTGVTLESGSISIGQSVATTDEVTFAKVTASVTGNVIGNVTGNVTGDVTGDVTGTVTSLSNHDTDDVVEGTRKYFTEARARAAVSVTDAGGDGSIAYNAGTGVITYTGPSAAETRAHLSAGTGIGYTNGEISIGQSVATDADVVFNQVNSDTFVGPLTGNVTTGNSGLIKIKNNTGKYIGLQASNSTTNNFTLTLPEADGGNGQVLKTNGAGDLEWGSGSAGVVKQMVSKTLHSGVNLPSVFTSSSDEVTNSAYQVNITPVSSSSKVLIMFKVGFRCSVEPLQRISFRIKRIVNGTSTTVVTDLTQGIGNAGGPYNGIYHSHFVDEPNSTNEVTYALSFELENTGIAAGEFSGYETGIVGGDLCTNCLVLHETEGSGVSGSIINKASDTQGAYYNEGTLHLGSAFIAANSSNVSDLALNLGGNYRLPATTGGIGLGTVSKSGERLSIDGGNVSYGTKYFETDDNETITGISLTNLLNNSQTNILIKNTSGSNLKINGSTDGLSGVVTNYASAIIIPSGGLLLVSIQKIGSVDAIFTAQLLA
ncbi:hypothetical protein N8996_01915, partial [Candidatus Poseidonia alphae]|nr:hypothetical protein [Candidatus Poseidonia alphae]